MDRQRQKLFAFVLGGIEIEPEFVACKRNINKNFIDDLRTCTVLETWGHLRCYVKQIRWNSAEKTRLKWCDQINERKVLWAKSFQRSLP